jgi:uncharacterized OB-fold protein
MHPVFADRVPYAVVVVHMDEGVRVVTSLSEAEPSALCLDLPVKIGFEPLADDVALLVAQPVR